MKVLLIVLGALALLALLPLGAYARYDSAGAQFGLILGPVRLSLLPKKKGKKPQKKKAPQKQPQAKPAPKKTKQKRPLGGLLRDFYPFVKLGLELFGYACRKLRVNDLTLHISFGGADDPAKAALNYGRAWAVIGAVMPQLRSRFRIKRENVSASCDFTADEMRVYAQWSAVFLLGDSIVMAVRYGLRAFRLYSAMKKRNNQNLISDKAVRTNESSST